jgi:hypothetical protein
MMIMMAPEATAQDITAAIGDVAAVRHLGIDALDGVDRVVLLSRPG